MQPNLLGKILFWGFRSKMAQNEVFLVFCQLNLWNFSNFLYGVIIVKFELQYSKVLKLPKILLWEKSSFEVSSPKSSKMCQKWGFTNFMKNLQSLIFCLFLCLFVFGKNLITRYSARRGPKWAQNKVFQVLSKVNAWNCSDFLHEVTAAKSLKLAINGFLGIILFWCFWTKKSTKWA